MTGQSGAQASGQASGQGLASAKKWARASAWAWPRTWARAQAQAQAARLVVVVFVVAVGAAGPVTGLGASTPHSGGPLGVPGIFGGPSAIGALPNAGAEPIVDVVDVIDVPVDNPVGEFGGGFAVALPTDVATLRPLLERARDSGIALERYATLTRQYWLAVSAENAGIDLNNWVPERGLTANLRTVDRVYLNYLRLANSRDDYFWAGMAGRAGM